MVIAIVSVTAIGILCAAMLAFASKVMAVKVDERFPKVRDCLPGANCGACGYAGCDGYAQALVNGETTKTNLCIPGADAVAKSLSDELGLEFEDVIEQVAVIKCRGDCNVTGDKMEYEGMSGCAAANIMYNGKGKCICGCLGLGDCVKACPNDAICIENGIAHVDTRRCTGCGICTKTCPNHLITVMADVERVLVTCSSTEKGALTRKACTHGCIACKKCEKVCETGAIKVENNLARIDYDKCVNCGKCAQVCTTGCIMIADFSGIHRAAVAEDK